MKQKQRKMVQAQVLYEEKKRGVRDFWIESKGVIKI